MDDSTKLTLAAFLGAFFAFVFMRLADFLRRYRERWAKHHTALVRLERLCSEQIEGLNRLEIDMRGMTEAHDASIAQGGVPYFINRLREVQTDSSVEFDLANLDLLNDVVRHRKDIEALNTDASRIDTVIDNLQRMLAEGVISPSDYTTNLAGLIASLADLSKHAEASEGETVTMLTKARLRLKRDRPVDHKLSLAFRRKKYESDFVSAVQKTRPEVEKEIDRSSKISAFRINKILEDGQE